MHAHAWWMGCGAFFVLEKQLMCLTQIVPVQWITRQGFAAFLVYPFANEA